MNEIIPFSFEGAEIRTVYKDNDPWFVAMDVCKALGIGNPRKAIQVLDDDEKDDVTLSDAIGRQQETNIINESGLYILILRSRNALKPDTLQHRFRKWVTNEVLPAIRKTGAYHPAPHASSAASNDQQELIEALRDKIALLEENRSLVKDRRVSSMFVGVARQLFEKTNFPDDTIAEILAPGIGTRMPEWVTWQRRRYH
ncbi:Bro-N domain-containing protein [Thalassospira sp. NFXS8]|uniref:BRO-N domain-containing protein n=1 Tax=Thalassospira sp. NFXS8 TaxID=2819093 RepID=UPI0032DE463F